MKETYPTRLIDFPMTPSPNICSREDLSAFLRSWPGKVEAVFCTCAHKGSMLRDDQENRSYALKGNGVYLLYENSKKEDYIRNQSKIDMASLRSAGMTYAVSNNSQKHTQIYTYEEGFNMLKSIPRDILNLLTSKGAIFKEHQESLVDSIDQAWWCSYYDSLKKRLDEFLIEIPDTTSVHYAERAEYFYECISSQLPVWEDENCAIVYVGDSAGGTDYRLGMSLGRGLLSVEEITKYTRCGDERMIGEYQKYWTKMIETEFRKDNPLTDASVMQKYIEEGRLKQRGS